MKFCDSCGKAYEDGAKACPHCGATDGAVVEAAATWDQKDQPEIVINGERMGGQQSQQAYNQGYAAQAGAGVDTGSFGWAVLGFCIPIVGLVHWLVWKDQKPQSAKMAGIGALVSVCVSAVMWVISAVLGIGAATMM